MLLNVDKCDKMLKDVVKMLAEGRLKEIERILNEKGSVIISNLSKIFKVSEETIRRDLEKLEKKNILKRVRGGAYLLSDNDKQVPLEIREQIFLEEKHEIAQECVNHIEDGETLMIDSSTTAICVAQEIEKKGLKLKVITNSIKVVEIFENSKWVDVVCIGGVLRKRTKSFVGNKAVEQLKDLRATKALISCTAIDKVFGITDDSEREAEIRKIMIKNSLKVFLLADRTKFDNLEAHLISELENIDVVITDKKISEEWQKKAKENKVEIIYTHIKN